MQILNDQVAAYCQQQMGLTAVPKVTDGGLELHFSEQCKLQLFLQGNQLWFLLDLGPTNTGSAVWAANNIERFDAPLCFFRVFTSTAKRLCVATALPVENVSAPNLDLVFERCHRIATEVSEL